MIGSASSTSLNFLMKYGKGSVWIRYCVQCALELKIISFVLNYAENCFSGTQLGWLSLLDQLPVFN